MFVKDFIVFASPEDSGSGDGLINDSSDSVDEIVSDDADTGEDAGDEDNEDNEEIISENDDEVAGEDEDEDEKPSKSKAKKDDDEENDENKDDNLDKYPVTGNVVKQAAKEFKGLFNKYPELRSNYFFARDIQQHFPTVESAKAAADTVNNFEAIVAEIDNGDPESIVEYIGSNKDTLYRFGRKFLNNVLEKNPDVFPYITGPYVAQLFKNADRDAKAANNKNLSAAVKILADYVFAKDGQIPDDPGIPEPPKADDKVTKYQTEVFNNFKNETLEIGASNLQTNITNSLAALKTKQPGLKKLLVQEIAVEINKAMVSDAAHMAKMQRLWNEAKKGKTTSAHRAAIVNAHADAIKKLLPEVRAKVLKSNGFKINKVKKTQKEARSFENVNRQEKAGSRNSPSARDLNNMSAEQRLLHYSKG